jgi:hypothetical protein
MSDLPPDADTLENARALALHYQSTAAAQGTQIIRLRIALKILREFGGLGRGFHAGVMATIKPWLEGNMQGPVPYPRSVFFDEWAASEGMSNVNGHVGYLLVAKCKTIPPTDTLTARPTTPLGAAWRRG